MFTETQLEDISHKVIARLRQENELQGAQFLVIVTDGEVFSRLTDMDTALEAKLLANVLHILDPEVVILHKSDMVIPSATPALELVTDSENSENPDAKE